MKIILKNNSKPLRRIFFFLLLINPLINFAQDGNIDLNYNSLNQISSPSDELISLENINTFSKQSNGKIIIGGFFTSINNININRIARLNADGTLDTSFNIGNGFTGVGYTEVKKLIVLPNDKIIVVGRFNSFNNITRNNIVRLNSDGTIDTTFNVGTATNGDITNLKLKSNNKILIGGAFTSYNNVAISKIAIINYDGSLDTTFNINSSATPGSLISIELQTDNKIIASFLSTSMWTGNAWGYIKRYNQDGTLDNTFLANNSAFISSTGNGGVLTYAHIYDIKQLSNNQILVAGDFKSVFGQAYGGIARLNSNGTVDTSFIGSGMTVPPTITVGTWKIFSIDVQSDNKIIIGGNFDIINSTNRKCIARLLPNGSLDTTFNPGSGINLTNFAGKEVIKCLKISQDNTILIGGTFDTYNNSVAKSITRLLICNSTPATIIATNDTFIVPNNSQLTQKLSVKGNDTFNGGTLPNNSTITIYQVPNSLTPIPSVGNISINSVGILVCSVGTTPGTYTLQYQINHNGSCNSTSNIATATVTILNGQE